VEFWPKAEEQQVAFPWPLLKSWSAKAQQVGFQ